MFWFQEAVRSHPGCDLWTVSDQEVVWSFQVTKVQKRKRTRFNRIQKKIPSGLKKASSLVKDSCVNPLSQHTHPLRTELIT